MFLDERDLSPAIDELSHIFSLSNKDLAESKKEYYITVNYVLIDTQYTSYNFSQDFLLRDTQQYFLLMKEFAGKTLDKLFEERHKYHLYPTRLNGKFAEVICKLYPQIDRNNPPDIYHFALYNDKDTIADKNRGTRSPRIYFIVGECGIIYPIFFDPYHELNPIPEINH